MLYLLDLFRIIIMFLYILSIFNKDNLMTVTAAVGQNCQIIVPETWKDGCYHVVINSLKKGIFRFRGTNNPSIGNTLL